MTREGHVEGDAPADEAAYRLLEAALSAKINVRLEHFADATADAERAGAAVALLLAAIAASKRASRS